MGTQPRYPSKVKNFGGIHGRQVRAVRTTAQIKERRQRALELRMAGASYAEIVKANIGYSSISHVSQDMKRILAHVKLESPEDLIMLDLARLDDLQKVLTLHFHKGEVGLSGAIMQVMRFRHELFGVDAESIRQRNLDRTQVTNNGIMVVQGTMREYLGSMMEAAGLTEEQKQAELRKLETRELESGITGNVIQGELITSENPSSVPSSNPSENLSSDTSSKGQKKVKKIKVRMKKEAPGSGEPAAATQTRSNRQGAILAPRDTEKPLESRLVAFSQALDEADEEREQRELPPARLSEPVLDVDLGALDETTLRQRVRERVLESRIKTPDNNIPAHPGVPYKSAPRKLTPEEGRKAVLRKLRPGADPEGELVDRIKVRTRREEIK